MIATIANILGFNIVWFTTVLGAATGRAFVGLLAYVVFAGWQLFNTAQPRRELWLTLALVTGGWLVDSTYVLLGLMQFTGVGSGAPVAPWWIALLWANFALLVNHSIAPLRDKPAIGAVLGALGAPLAYFTAERLDAVSFTAGAGPALAATAIAWAAAVPLMFLINRRITGLLHGSSRIS